MEFMNANVADMRKGASDLSLRNEALKQATQDLEASFLSEMLRSAGVGKVSQDWGGGVGEDHFSSFLVDIQAQQMAERGGIGLAQDIYEKLKETE